MKMITQHQLEDVFLKLTEQDSSEEDIVKKLRNSYKKKIEGVI